MVAFSEVEGAYPPGIVASFKDYANMEGVDLADDAKWKPVFEIWLNSARQRVEKTPDPNVLPNG